MSTVSVDPHDPPEMSLDIFVLAIVLACSYLGLRDRKRPPRLPISGLRW